MYDTELWQASAVSRLIQDKAIRIPLKPGSNSRFHLTPITIPKLLASAGFFTVRTKTPFLNELYLDDNLVDADIFPASSQLKVIRWTFDSPAKELMLKFKGQSSPEIYGIALDGRRGVAVDNIPLRGCSGLFFTLFDEQLMTADVQGTECKTLYPAVWRQFCTLGTEQLYRL